MRCCCQSRPCHHRQPLDITATDYVHQQSAQEGTRASPPHHGQLSERDSSEPLDFVPEAARVANADDLLRDFISPSANSTPSITFSPPHESINFEERYPSCLSSLDTGSGAEEFERTVDVLEVKQYSRAPSHARRTRSEVIRAPLGVLKNGPRIHAQPILRARSVSVRMS